MKNIDRFLIVCPRKLLDTIANLISTRHGFWCYPESFSKSYQHKLERQPIYFCVKLGWYRQRQMYTVSKRTALYTIECPGSNHDFTMPIKLHCQNTVCQKWNWQNSICQNSNWQNSICRSSSMPKFQLPKYTGALNPRRGKLISLSYRHKVLRFY